MDKDRLLEIKKLTPAPLFEGKRGVETRKLVVVHQGIKV